MPIILAADPPSDPTDVALAEALRRLLATSSAPMYLRQAAQAWLTAHPTLS